MIYLCEMRSSAPASPFMREITIATVFGGRAGGDLSRVEGDPDIDVDEKDGDGRFDEPHGVR